MPGSIPRSLRRRPPTAPCRGVRDGGPDEWHDSAREQLLARGQAGYDKGAGQLDVVGVVVGPGYGLALVGGQVWGIYVLALVFWEKAWVVVSGVTYWGCLGFS